MVSILISILIISQLVSFYLIVLLSTKVAKFKDLEFQQEKLVSEMDNAIGAYLMEMKEENERLVKELSSINRVEITNDVKKERNLVNLNLDEALKEEPLTITQPIETKENVLIEPKSFIPKTFAANAYNRQKEKIEATVIQENLKPEKPIQPTSKELPTFEQKVIKLHKDGKSIEEIAKMTQKGKTEIELLVKFHS